jgi:transporter family-2 protein
LKNPILIGAGIAVITGIIAGIQATISGKVGTIIGPVRTGIMTNILGGSVGLLIAGFILLYSAGKVEIPSKSALTLMLVSGTLGVIIVMGVSFSISQAGVAAGLAAIILGQMVVSLFVDTAGLGGSQPIPITSIRVAGLLVLALGVYMLLPRN